MRFAWFCSILEGCMQRFASWKSLFSIFGWMSAAESLPWEPILTLNGKRDKDKSSASSVTVSNLVSIVCNW